MDIKIIKNNGFAQVYYKRGKRSKNLFSLFLWTQNMLFVFGMLVSYNLFDIRILKK